MAPLPAYRMWSIHQLAVDHDAAPGAGTDDYTEDHLVIPGGATERFRECETIGIILDTNLSFQAESCRSLRNG